MGKKGKTGIVYQNKDITTKVMAERFKGKIFEAYGLKDMPEIVDVLDTNLPKVEANELRLDNLFKLSDGSFAIIDYESKYSVANKFKYLNYIARVEQRLYNNLKRTVPLRFVVIYTADVEKGSTEPVLEAGCVRVEITEAFLIDLDSQDIYRRVSEKFKAGKELSDRELMDIVIYPLTYKKLKAKRKAIKKVLELVAFIKDDMQKYYVLKMLIAFTDKVITKKDSVRIGEMLMVTKVEQYLLKQERKRAKKKMRNAVKKLLQNGVDAGTISDSFSIPLSKVHKIEEKMLQKA